MALHALRGRILPEPGDLLLTTADTHRETEVKFQHWGTVVRGLGLWRYWGVKICDHRLPDSRGHPMWTYGIYLSLQEGVTLEQAIEAARLTRLGNVMERWRTE
jgi:hypothetical protein